MKICLLKIHSALPGMEEYNGKYINDIAWIPNGPVPHVNIIDAVEETLEHALCSNRYDRTLVMYDYEEAKTLMMNIIKRKTIWGFEEVEFIDVEV